MGTRKDARFSSEEIVCPNSISNTIARIGSIVVYQVAHADNSMENNIGRVLGRADADGTDGPKVEKHILVLQLSDDMSFCYERWIDPCSVVRIINCPYKFLKFFFAKNLPYDAETMIRLADYGTLCENYEALSPSRKPRHLCLSFAMIFMAKRDESKVFVHYNRSRSQLS